LTATGSYTATITLYVYGVSQTSATFTFTVATAYTTPTMITPTFSAFDLPASSNTTTPAITATMTAGTFDAASAYTAGVYLTGAAPQGVAWGTIAFNSAGNFDSWSPLTPVIGRWCGQAFLPYSGVSLTSGYSLPQGLTITTGGATIRKTAVSASNSFTSLPGNNNFMTTAGTVDTTPPACTAANFAQTSIPTGTTPGVTVVVTVTCTGAQYMAAIVRATSGSIHDDALVANGVGYTVPLFHTGTAEVIGVIAVDTAGNAVLYGSCGDLADSMGTLCGGGGSSSSTVVASLAVVMMCIMTVLQLAF